MKPITALRRGVILPHDDGSVERVLSKYIDGTVTISYLNIDDASFYPIYSSGLFTDINDVCRSLIDDYEEGVVTAQECVELVSMLEGKYVGSNDDEVSGFAKGLVLLAKDAVAKKKPLVFVL